MRNIFNLRKYEFIGNNAKWLMDKEKEPTE